MNRSRQRKRRPCAEIGARARYHLRNKQLICAAQRLWVASKTGRNQPSAKRFAFGLASWQGGVIRPPEGWGLGYVDLASQQVGIAAGLSGDERLIEAYETGDPYLGFGKQAGVIPPDATRESHFGRARNVQGDRAGPQLRSGSGQDGLSGRNFPGPGCRVDHAPPQDVPALLAVEQPGSDVRAAEQRNVVNLRVASTHS